MKTMNPDANIIILYRDIRSYGFREKHYGQAREMGINFIRYELDNKPVVTKQGDQIIVSAYDSILGATLNIPTDLLVLSSRINPNPDNDELSQFF